VNRLFPPLPPLMDKHVTDTLKIYTHPARK
jgi:hypothetical protein